MTAASPHAPGRFVWHELFTPDLARAQAFYGELLGWAFESRAGEAGETYTTIMVGGAAQGGLVATPHPSVPAHFMGYVAVNEPDASAAAASAAGGKVLAAPMDAAPAGRLAVLRDPSGAPLSVLRPAEAAAPAGSRPGAGVQVGAFCWNQLSSSNPDEAKVFYERVFGWTARRFGRGRDIEAFTTPDGQIAAGLLAGRSPVPSHWLSFLAVEDLPAARWRLRKLGGETLLDDIPIPGLGTVSFFRDPNGAVAGLLAAEAPSDA